MKEKKLYKKPEIKEYGDLKIITQGAGGDLPEGSTFQS